MNCECNNNSNRVKPRIKHVYGNVLRIAIPLTLRTLVKDGDEMIVNDTDFIPSSEHSVRVVFSKGKTNYPIIATMDGNVAIIEDKGKIPEGTYDISVECYDDIGNPYRFKQNAVLYVADTTAEAGIDEEIEYEAQTWYLNAAVFLATTEIGEIGDVIDAKLDDVFGNVLYDANAKEIRFYNKGNSRVLATIDSRPFIVDGTVSDVYIDVSRQVLVVVLNEDAGGRRFSVPLYLVFNSYYKKDEVDSLVSRTVENVRLDFSQELPFVVPVTKNGSSISSSIDYGTIDNAIHEDGRLVVACVNNGKFYQLLNANGMEVVFSRVVALDGYQELLIVDESNVWSMEDVDLGTGGGGYEPPAGGIPKSDLAQSVQDTLDDVDNKVDKETGKGLSTNDYTTAEKTKLQNLPTATELTTQLGQKANDNAVVKSISVNGQTPQTPTNGNVNIEVSGGGQTSGLTEEDISVETQGDGTVDINVGDDTYTVNLNHTHENMAKLVITDEEPSNPALDTIYALVDDVEGPSAIQSLWIAGLEFVGGGGIDPTIPALTSPADESTIRLDNIISPATSVEKTIKVKGTQALTEALTATLDGTGYTFGQTQPSGVTRTDGTHLTITAVAAKAGVNIVIVSSNTAENATGTLTIASTEVGCECTLLTPNVVYEEISSVKLTGSQWLNTGYTPNANTIIDADVTFISKNNHGSNSSCIGLNSDSDTAGGVMYIWATSASFNQISAKVGTGSGTIAQTSMNPYGRRHLVLGNSKFSIDGNEKSCGATPNFSSSVKLCIGNNASQILDYYDFTIHRFKILETENGVDSVVMDFVPMMKNGVPGLYDSHTKTFISSETSTELDYEQ